jgi:hypothetical protein
MRRKRTGIFPNKICLKRGDSWRPGFLDYLFLAYCNATAFSPTGAVPLRGRAMVLMMAESAVSLITLAVIAARAINILDN